MDRHDESGDWHSFGVKFSILKALDQPIETITVDAICKNSGISRRTFYNHFESKHALLPWWSAWCEQFALDQIGRTMTWEEGYYWHIHLMMYGKSFLVAAVKNGVYFPFFGGYQISVRRKEIIRETLVDYCEVELSDELSFCIDSLTHLESEIFSKWCQEGLNLSRREYASMFLNIVPPKLYETMQLSEVRHVPQLKRIEQFCAEKESVLSSSNQPELGSHLVFLEANHTQNAYQDE